MLIQPRDIDLLCSVHRHRFLTAGHIHALYFRGRSLRAAQARLKELHDAGFLERTYLMPPIDGEHRRVRPLYSLARAGAEVVAERLGAPLRTVPHTAAANRIGYEHLLHELVVTDFLVSAEVVLGVHTLAIDRDHSLRSALSAHRRRHRIDRAIVPDGALTTVAATLPAPTTIYLEVVHTGVKGGNARLVEKLNRYVELNRGGYFARVFGHQRVRAVVIISPSSRRLEHLRSLAARRVTHGRRLVWFAVAPRHLSRTHPPTTFTPDALATTVAADLDGNAHHVSVDAFR